MRSFVVTRLAVREQSVRFSDTKPVPLSAFAADPTEMVRALIGQGRGVPELVLTPEEIARLTPEETARIQSWDRR